MRWSDLWLATWRLLRNVRVLVRKRQGVDVQVLPPSVEGRVDTIKDDMFHDRSHQELAH